MARYRTAIAINVSVFLLMIGVGMIVSILPRTIIALTGSVAQTAILASAFAVSYVLVQVPLGYCADRTGFRLFLAAGYLVCACVGVLYFLASSPVVIYLGRLLQGLGEAPLWALAPALLAMHFPEQKGKAMGIYNASLHLGLTTGPILGVLLVSCGREGSPFLVFALLSLIGGILTLLFAKDPATVCRKEGGRAGIRSTLGLLRTGDVSAVFAGVLLYGSGYGLFLTIIPAYLIHDIGFSQQLVGVFFTLFYVAVGMTQICSGILSDRRGRTWYMVIGMLVAATGLALFTGGGAVRMVSFLFLAGLGLGSFSVSSMAFLNEAVPDDAKGTVSGAYYLFWGMGFFLGPMIFGRFEVSSGFTGLFMVFSALLVVEAACLMVITRQRSRIRTQ